MHYFTKKWYKTYIYVACVNKIIHKFQQKKIYIYCTTIKLQSQVKCMTNIQNKQ